MAANPSGIEREAQAFYHDGAHFRLVSIPKLCVMDAMADQRPDTQHKALQINLDHAKYGTFAEIGAGQEVARWFFRVGGASGTVAKTMSAYDMAVSDAIYGPCDRYVSRQRLQSMLDHEYGLLIERLDAKRGDKTTFFVFADTVAAKSFAHQQDGQGWLGIRFQHVPRTAPSQIIIHARMWDADNEHQQEALGILGVNLIHSAFYLHSQPEQLIGALMDNLTRDRMEVDMIQFSGPAFQGVDNRLMSLQLAHQRLTNAAIFTAQGEVVEPAEVLYHKPVLIERGSFRPVTNVTHDMLQRSLAQLQREPDMKGQQPVVLMEMTLRNLLATGPAIDHVDFLARVDTLSALGRTVMVSNYSRFHNVATYLRRYTQNRIVMALGVPTLAELFEEKYYHDLEGGVLEALGRIFKGSVKLYVYPWKNVRTGEVVDAGNFKVVKHLQHLYAHLLDNKFIEPIREISAADLAVLPRDVLALIQSGDPGWEKMVPQPVADVIKRNRLFGFKPGK